ncbi:MULTISPECIES: DUF2184 domain-containing protein [unclassified Pseudomonas]|uniref:DUF2184 domain-containing protein n=1 Tax=unclassified Pseudomonas TaxID=196821 RepID=UPI000BDA0D06|nr:MULTISPECIES: major capsid family protein [unclassified Pseudomonas]PVZ19930.1 hypothetical protein F474_00521 [Pseudomonas sp. URIL14HWK12:I12]PVZ26996.1 hypothetical protein F470_00176 [Pseudomonas sp. URIL14HWK12:I10]PVZ37885.1 hypothetical protein F472_00521 [Pseudomonas sp. URIL14HWK12:I11]SNZ05279.1 hypothetical protein SAMN05660463_00883 [Pseudomonas sp. URIL14HWK12:I9]
MRPNFMLDAQAALGFVISQTAHIETQVNETVYPDIQYPTLVPVDTSANPWAKTVTYFTADKFGRADWINGNADDIPLAGTELSRQETSVHMAGIGYGYGLEEISQAAMLGINLDAADAAAARRAYEEMVERVALYGDTTKNFYGLTNAPAVVAASALTGSWDTASPAQILADVNAALAGQYAGTLYTGLADTLLLPYSKFLKISTTPLNDNGTDTILSWLQTKNVYTAQTGRPLTIRAMRGLDKAGAGSTARMVAYRRDPNVVKMHIPMPHRFLPVYQAGPTRWEVPGIFRLGGVDVRRPKEMSYTDGL